jgi:glycosyltransferase involved in cell wall biosynthesis
MVKKLVFWWNHPCRSILGLCDALAEATSCQVTLVALDGYSELRAKLGWGAVHPNRTRVAVFTRDTYQEKSEELRNDLSTVHILNSVYSSQALRWIAHRLAETGQKYWVMSEAPTNAFHGLKYAAKVAYHHLYVPLIARPLASRSMGCFCLSGGSSESMHAMVTMGFDQRTLVPFGYYPAPLPIPAVRRLPSNGKIELLCTGVLEPSKGHAVLLRALALARQRGLRFRCSITGFGSQESHLRRLTEELHLGTQVNWVGAVPDERLYELIAQTDVFLAPGIREPWGIRLNDAIQAGLPVITTSGLGAAELVRAARCGTVVRPGDHAALAESILELALDDAKLSMCRTNARSFAPTIAPANMAGRVISELSRVVEIA